MMKSEEIRESEKKVGQLYPILTDLKGNIIDGFHRRAANPQWRKIKLGWVKTPTDLLKIRLHSNWMRRNIDRAEIEKILSELYEETGWDTKQAAKKLGISYDTLVDYYPKGAKDQKKAKAGRKRKKKRGVGRAPTQPSESQKKDAEGFNPEITTLWDFPQCDPKYGKVYPGRMPGQVVENLLRFCKIEKRELVVDPLAGGGTTIDVCNAKGVRCSAFDLAPIREDIKHNDISLGIPVENKTANLVILDPPYWRAKEGRYSAQKKGKEVDLAHVPLETFYNIMAKTADECLRILKPSGVVALLMAPENKKGKFIDLTFECYKIFEKAGFRPKERIGLVYHGAASQTGVWRYRAKKYRFLLRGFRDLLVFEKHG